MIPIDTFRSDATVTELNHHDEINFDTALRRLDARQKPVHPLVMRERGAQLVHKLIITDNAVECRHLLILGPSGNEHVAIKRAKLVLPVPACVHRHVIDVCVVHHRGQSGVHVLRGELTVQMLRPQFLHIRSVHRDPLSCAGRFVASYRPRWQIRTR
jgi:hypothetical protein